MKKFHHQETEGKKEHEEKYRYQLVQELGLDTSGIGNLFGAIASEGPFKEGENPWGVHTWSEGYYIKAKKQEERENQMLGASLGNFLGGKNQVTVYSDPSSKELQKVNYEKVIELPAGIGEAWELWKEWCLIPEWKVVPIEICGDFTSNAEKLQKWRNMRENKGAICCYKDNKGEWIIEKCSGNGSKIIMLPLMENEEIGKILGNDNSVEAKNKSISKILEQQRTKELKQSYNHISREIKYIFTRKKEKNEKVRWGGGNFFKGLLRSEKTEKFYVKYGNDDKSAEKTLKALKDYLGDEGNATEKTKKWEGPWLPGKWKRNDLTYLKIDLHRGLQEVFNLITGYENWSSSKQQKVLAEVIHRLEKLKIGYKKEGNGDAIRDMRRCVHMLDKIINNSNNLPKFTSAP